MRDNEDSRKMEQDNFSKIIKSLKKLYINLIIYKDYNKIIKIFIGAINFII